MGFRFFVLNLIFVSLFGLLGLNLYNLQFEKGGYYFKQARARVEYQQDLKLRRGSIFFTDKNNNEIPIALNKDYPVIFAVPKEINNPDKVAQKLAPIINQEEDDIADDIDNPDSLFRLLVEKASTEQVNALRSEKIEGVYIDQKQHRFYPFKKLASKLVGFVGVNESYDQPTGLYGVESFYDDSLKEGEEIFLTIDRTLQAESEKVISNLIKEHEAEGGSIIIQDPMSGEILALANEPGFDPNNYSDYPVKNFINSSIQHVYEAGSVFKPLTMSAGIDLGIITPESTYTDKGYVELNGRTIRNWDKKSHGKITMTGVIENSINTGAVWAAQQIGKQNLVNYFEDFGFGSKTNIGLPDEVNGSLSNLKSDNSREIDLATASFGQGISVTPIQLINAYSAVANGGLLMRPYINKDEGSYVVKRVLKEETTREVLGMMESAVEKAIIGDVSGYRVAGKTGTAQIPNFQTGGYSDEYTHTFVGIGPMSDPRFVILIKLDKPNEDLAGRTVVPAFKDLARFVFNYYQISPDDFDEINN